MSKITTHILDTARGRPAAGVAVRLFRFSDEGGWDEAGMGVTNEDGRVSDWGHVPAASVYKIRFETGSYFAAMGAASFYPCVEVHFIIENGGHYHLPLLLSPFGYSTYRGS